MRIIDADALLKAMEEERQYLLARGQTGAEHIIVHHCLPIIDNAPTVFDDKAYSDGYTQGTCDCEHAHERQKGEWIEDYTKECHSFLGWHCSICNTAALEINEYSYASDFCPTCGAKMNNGGTACLT